MREIKFRCWDEKLKRWEYWGLPEDAGYIAGRFNKQNATKKGRRFSTLTMGQFTGLLDKNGKEIFEGDILQCTAPCENEGYRTSPVWEDGKYQSGKLRTAEDFNRNLIEEDKLEIIGNIYENENLLK